MEKGWQGGFFVNCRMNFLSRRTTESVIISAFSKIIIINLRGKNKRSQNTDESREIRLSWQTMTMSSSFIIFPGFSISSFSFFLEKSETVKNNLMRRLRRFRVVNKARSDVCQKKKKREKSTEGQRSLMREEEKKIVQATENKSKTFV